MESVGVGGASLDGVVEECLCEEVTFEWRPELQRASHTLQPKGLQKCAVVLNRTERVSINIKGQGASAVCLSQREEILLHPLPKPLQNPVCQMVFLLDRWEV